MSRTPQSPEEIKRQFDEQLQFLQNSAKGYDDGNKSEAKRIASILRILFHDSSSNKPLLKQLGLKETRFYDTVCGARDYFTNGQQIGSFSGLVAVTAGERGGYVPVFDSAILGFAECAPFEEYWGRVIFIDGQGISFTRKDLVCNVADQDGGAHVDSAINSNHYDLTRSNSMGLEVSSNGSTPLSLERPDLPALRQIAHEVLRTLIPDYPHKNMKTNNMFVMPSLMIVANSSENSSTRLNAWKNVGPYDMCPCKSDKKYKWCCGKK